MSKKPAAALTLHFEKVVRAPLDRCVAPFRTTRGLRQWWDPTSRLSAFRAGGIVTATDLPGFEIAAIVGRQLIAHHFTSYIDGVAIWSFVPGARNTTRIVLDHVADGNQDDAAGRTFYWRGLVENLAAVAEKRPVPFVNGRFVGKKLPKGIRYRTMQEFVEAW